jgi:hypothetical protein
MGSWQGAVIYAAAVITIEKVVITFPSPYLAS